MSERQGAGTSGRWVLVVNGELPPDAPSRLTERLLAADKVVAVDGGLRHCADLGVWPSMLIGDLDSADAEIVALAELHDMVVHTFPADKDATDLELALELALESRPSAVLVVAAFGGRLDHELATVSLLASDRWASLRIGATDGVRQLDVIRDRHTLRLEPGSTVSLLPWHGPAHGVTTQGLQWALKDATLAPGTTHGVSNIAVDPIQEISIGDGVLVVVADPTT